MKDSITITDEEGEEIPYFSPKFLVIKYLKMAESDLELNEKYKLEEKLAKQKGGDSEEDEDSGDKGGDEDDMSGGDESESDEGSSDIDDEMLGDVQPESPETTEA